jgi:hypothetical protein
VKNGQRAAEPLVLRANAGECIHVELINEFDINSDTFTQFPVPQNGILGLTGGSPYGGGTPETSTVPTANYGIELFTSQTAGLHPQLVAYDVTKNDGLNVGRNPVHTVPAQGCSPHCSTVYEWYAGALYDPSTGAGGASTAKYHPHAVEFGGTNLLPADLLQQHQQGLYGALIIEPAGSKITPDAGTNASATVTPPAGKPFRDFALIMNDDMSESFPEPNSGQTAIPVNTSSAINYGTEPWVLRMGFNIKKRAFNTFDLSCGLSNKLVTNSTNFTPGSPVGDFRTPIYAAGAGSEVRFHVLNPGGVNDQVFELHGHVWQEEPYTKRSTIIGHNPLSQWQGMRMGHGPTDHFDVVLPSAGGTNKVQGDYLYRAHYDLGFQGGALGAFRVGAPNKDIVSLTADFQSPTELYAYNTVNTATGQYATSVDVFNGPPGGAGCTGTKIGTVTTIAAGNGFWQFAIPAGTTNLCAISNLGGIGALDLVALKKLPPACGPWPPAVGGQAAPSDEKSNAAEKEQQMTRPSLPPPHKIAPKK